MGRRATIGKTVNLDRIIDQAITIGVVVKHHIRDVLLTLGKVIGLISCAIFTVVAVNDIIARTAANGIIACAPLNAIIPSARSDVIVPSTAVQIVSTRSTVDSVIARAAKHDVIVVHTLK